MNNKEFFLEGLQEDGRVWITKIDKYPFILGRGKSSNLVLSNSSVSRKHAEIILIKDEIFICDSQSTNGTLLNGRLIKDKTRLHDKDVINICNFEFRVKSREDIDLNDQTIITGHNSPINSFSSKYKLTPREEELLSYLVKGISTKEIASIMFISPGTAKNHILKLLKKTDTHSRLELITKYNNN
ncbi:FHA domain-containing protein [Thiospirochaeta perfilievii]|nr:FHA domain-containing protein [Thiospirochaeta perfilievii]